MDTSRFPLLNAYIRRWSDGFDGVPWQAAIELFVIGMVIYTTLRFLQGTRGARLMQAVLAILTGFLVLKIIAQLLQLDRLNVLYPYFVSGVFLIALVVFQPELRRGLMRIGETFGRKARAAESAGIINPLVEAAASLSKRKIGALVAIERAVPVGGLRETGVQTDSAVSRELLETIFWPGSALHDLGVIISHGRIAAAGCEFPLAETSAAERVLGSRHRAALGMSLDTDALVVVVSEETGNISVAERGVLHGPLTADTLRAALEAGLFRKQGSVSEASTPEPEEPKSLTDEDDAELPAPSTTDPATLPSQKDSTAGVSPKDASSSPQLISREAG